MPIYEYRCESCKTELEKLQKISDLPLVECPECGNPTLVKLISASSFRLKGAGWYETDFKTGNKKNGAGTADSDKGAEKSDSGNTADTAKASAGKTDAGKTDAGKSDTGKKDSGKAEKANPESGSAGKGKSTTAANKSANI
mgnify:CR=1 FL=1